MHDANGTELKVGDKVMIEAEIVDVQAYDEFCNATVRPRPMRGRTSEPENTDDMTVNTGQLVLLHRPSGGGEVKQTLEAMAAPDPDATTHNG